MRKLGRPGKRIFSMLLCIALLVTMYPQTASAVSGGDTAEAEDVSTGNAGDSILKTVKSAMLRVGSGETGDTGAFTVTGGTYGEDYTYADGVLTILTGTALTIQNTDSATATTDRIVVAKDVAANIILAGVNIDIIGNVCPLNMSSAGDCTITLQENTENILNGADSGTNNQENCPGIWAPNSHKLTITGTGALTATGGRAYPGIGGSSINIVIESGTITATGGYYAAGIGGAWGQNVGTITILGGTVTARGGEKGAGIGGGYSQSGGTITISGGTVTATGGAGGAGIGGGGYGGRGGTITISGGTVTATGGSNGAGIGGGEGYTGSLTFSTGDNGNALIKTSSMGNMDGSDSWSALILDSSKSTVTVYGTVTLSEGLEIPSGYTMSIPESASLTVAKGVTLTNNGTLNVAGELTNDGTVTNNREVYLCETTVNTITGSGVIKNAYKIKVVNGSVIENGITVGDKTYACSGEVIKVKADSLENKVFSNWTAKGTASGASYNISNDTSETLSITMNSTEAITVTANFTDAVAKVTKDSTVSYYASISAALSNAAPGSTVTLLQNVDYSEDGNLKINETTVTFDLGGKTLNLGGYSLELTNDADVTVQNGTITSNDDQTILVANGTVVIASGTVKGDYGIEVQGGTVEVSGGEVSGGTYGIYSEGSVKVTGGTITGGTSGIAFSSDGSLSSITGGTISSLSSDANPAAIVSGTLNEDGTVTGPLFLVKPDAGYIAEPFECTTTNTDEYYYLTLKSKYVAKVTAGDGTLSWYTSLSNALDAATTGSTVALLKDTQENLPTVKTKTLTLNLGGYTLTSDNPLCISGGGDVTIQNGTITSSGSYTIRVEDGGTVTIAQNAVIQNTGHSGSAVYGSSFESTTATINVTGGTVKSTDSGNGILSEGGGDNVAVAINISDDRSSVSGEYAIYAHSGKSVVKVTGGTISGGSQGIVLNESEAISQCSITGGTISKVTYDGSRQATNLISIATDGTRPYFKEKPSEKYYAADTYEIVEVTLDGNPYYTLRTKDAEWQIVRGGRIVMDGTAFYSGSGSPAFNNAQKGDTVELLKDVAECGGIHFDGSHGATEFTFDLGKHTLTSNEDWTLVNVTLKIQNGTLNFENKCLIDYMGSIEIAKGTIINCWQMVGHDARILVASGTVNGNISVDGGRGFQIEDGKVKGNVSATQTAYIKVAGGKVEGNVSATQTAYIKVAGGTVEGEVSATQTAYIKVAGGTITGKVTIDSYTDGTSITGGSMKSVEVSGTDKLTGFINLSYDTDGNITGRPHFDTKPDSTYLASGLALTTDNTTGYTNTVALDLTNASLTLADTDNLVYNGKEQKPSVTVALNGKTVAPANYKVSYTDNINTSETAASSATKVNAARVRTSGSNPTVTVEGKSGSYYVNSVSATFAISPAELTITAADKSAKVGETAPSLANPTAGTDYTVTGLVGDDTLTTAPTLAYASTPDMTKTGTVAITASGADAGSNYTITYVNGKLTIAAKDEDQKTEDDNKSDDKNTDNTNTDDTNTDNTNTDHTNTDAGTTDNNTSTDTGTTDNNTSTDTGTTDNNTSTDTGTTDNTTTDTNAADSGDDADDDDGSADSASEDSAVSGSLTPATGDRTDPVSLSISLLGLIAALSIALVLLRRREE